MLSDNFIVVCIDEHDIEPPVDYIPSNFSDESSSHNNTVCDECERCRCCCLCMFEKLTLEEHRQEQTKLAALRRKQEEERKNVESGRG